MIACCSSVINNLWSYPSISHVFKAPALLHTNIFSFLLTITVETEGNKSLRNIRNRVCCHTKHLTISTSVTNHGENLMSVISTYFFVWIRLGFDSGRSFDCFCCSTSICFVLVHCTVMWIMSDELEWSCSDITKATFRHYCSVTEDNHENIRISHDSDKFQSKHLLNTGQTFFTTPKILLKENPHFVTLSFLLEI